VTDHTTTVEQPATHTYGYSGLSKQKSTNPNDMIGSQELMNGLKGFGEDASSMFIDALIVALHKAEFDPKPHPTTSMPTQEEISALWIASVDAFLSEVPDTAYMVLADIQTPREFTPAEKLAHVTQLTHAPYVTPYRSKLIPQLAPSSIDLKRLTTVKPNIVPDHVWHQIPGWRYNTTAETIWYNMGPHLRTTEMADPNAVWRILVGYFWKIQGLRDVLNKTQAGRADYPSFILAIYEQTMRLLHEQWHETERYQAAISHRPTAHSYHVLQLPPRGNGLNFIQTDEFDEAHHVRIMAYNDLLLCILANCHATLRSCD